MPPRQWVEAMLCVHSGWHYTSHRQHGSPGYVLWGHGYWRTWKTTGNGEAAWDAANTGYGGGLQMDSGFQRTYGPEFLARYGAAGDVACPGAVACRLPRLAASRVGRLAEHVAGVRAACDDVSDTEAVRYLVQRMGMDAGHHGLTGISSDALVVAAFTGEDPWRNSYPWDRSDWRRCLVAYALAPQWLRERMRPTMRAYRAALDRRYWRWGCPFPRTDSIKRLGA